MCVRVYKQKESDSPKMKERREGKRKIKKVYVIIFIINNNQSRYIQDKYTIITNSIIRVNSD